MMKTLLVSISLFVISVNMNAQSCSPQGNQTSYGSNNVWIGYVYDNQNLTTYKGYINEGSSSSPNFDEDFGGDDVNFNTHGCPVSTSTFSVRFKLSKTFSNATYNFVIGGDDGYRFSLDGGNTWVVNNWNDHSYTTSTYSVTLNGTYNLVLEYYENGGANRVTFNVNAACSGSTTTYGTGNTWKAYVYAGTNFDTYKGSFNAGSSSDPTFDESFGGSNTTFNTSCSSITTESFSVRFRLSKSFTAGNYTFFVGGDDGFRLSVDGGNTWLIDRWVLQSYNVTSATVYLSGTKNLVLEYYENSGDNRISFAMSYGIALPVKLLSFTGEALPHRADLKWKLADGSNPASFDIEKSSNGADFTSVHTMQVQAAGLQGDMDFTYSDATFTGARTFYRIKMTDLSGVVSYTKTISLAGSVVTAVNNSNTPAVAVYPTVFTGGSLNIKSASTLERAQVTISNAAGTVISRTAIGRVNANSPVSFTTNGGHMPAGMYFVQITDNNTVVTTQKIIVQ